MCGKEQGYYQPQIHVERWSERSTQCMDPEHNPPSHLYIPPGTIHEHKCPKCGNVIQVSGPPTSSL